MAKIYKLNQEIINLILTKHRQYPQLGCRKLSRMICQEKGILLSKSSINQVLNKAGMHLPVGRRRKKAIVSVPALHIPQLPVACDIPVVVVPEQPAAVPAPLPLFDGWGSRTPCTGALVLKAVDYLIGGISLFSGVAQPDSGAQIPDLAIKLQKLLYVPLVTGAHVEAVMSALLARTITAQASASIDEEMKGISVPGLKIARFVPGLFQENLCARFTLSDARTFCVDAQLHTMWSTLNIPYDFCGPSVHTRRWVADFLEGAAPLCLFMAPGFDVPTKELFFLLDGIDGNRASFTKCTSYGPENKEMEIIPCDQSRRRSCVFALWPWQFSGYRQIKDIAEFSPFADPVSGQTLYKAELTLELAQPDLKRSVLLSGYAVKNTPQDKLRFIVLSSNYAVSGSSDDAVCCYLRHWPHLEETFRDFSRKVELFTYAANTRRQFTVDSAIDQRAPWDINSFIRYYLYNIDKYFRWHFLPEIYQRWSLEKTTELVYSLPAQIDQRDSCVSVILDASGAAAGDLSYACSRLNERAIRFPEAGLPVYFSLSHA